MTYYPVKRTHASPLQSLADDRRGTPTKAEQRLERILNTVNGGALRGRFIREWVCGRDWIVDFFFPEVRLAVEVNGPYHRTPEQLFRDVERELEIEKFGVTVIRFTNEQVFGNREALLARLRSGWRTASAAFKAKAPTKTPKQNAPAPTLDAEVGKSQLFRPARRDAKPFEGGWTSLQQGMTRIGDNFPRQHIDEGIAGSRDANREMRKQQRVDGRKPGSGR